ncbi:hypothetical protein, partial [Enterococcus casseliflavus]|uniref:hypothetical protein n=1 Tax=Enterococcus casseliflavus TaxID=37734 RepID=UPI0022DEBD6E
FDQRSNGFGLTAGRNDEILTRWNLEKILTNRVRGIDSNPHSNFFESFVHHSYTFSLSLKYVKM